MAAGEAGHDAALRGIAHLEEAARRREMARGSLQRGRFPRVFYFRYHGYSAIFPLWALARHANLMPLNDRTVRHGM